MSNIASRERVRQRRMNEQRRSTFVWVLVILGGLALAGFLVWEAIRPPVGHEIPIMGAGHIPEDSDPGEYNSDPPTSGPHYAQPLDPGFYEQADLADLGPFPHAYAVHNLEHGYIIFWYNCDLLDENSCVELKRQIRNFMDGSLVPKLIAFPWQSTDVPLVLTSWGYRLEMPVFNASEANAFISANRLRAPEPNAP